MKEELLLKEYDEHEICLSTSEAAILRRVLYGKLDILLTDKPGYYLIRTNSYVGIVSLPGERTLVIRPKILEIDTLFYLLSVAYDPIREIFREETQKYSTVSELFEFVVDLYVKRVEYIIKRGLLRGYRQRKEESVAVKGRMLLAETFRHRPGLHDRHYCSYSQFTSDLPENRILRWTAFCLQHHAYREKNLRRRLRRIVLAFSEAKIDPESKRLFEQLQSHRLNDWYHPALALAKLLLDHLTFSGSTGSEPFLSYLVDMNWLFERYLSEIVLKAADQWDIQMQEQTEYALDKDCRICVKPDIVLSAGGKQLLVVDAKYKRDANRGDLYQMIAYCHALELSKAVLVYPANEQAPTGRISIKGQGNMQISLLSLDLSGTPEHLEAQGKALTEQIRKLLDVTV